MIERARDWRRAGRRGWLLTVTHTVGASPRPPGSLAAIRDDGILVGSVSGGCVEGAVVSEFSTKSRDESDVFTDPQIMRAPQFYPEGIRHFHQAFAERYLAAMQSIDSGGEESTDAGWPDLAVAALMATLDRHFGSDATLAPADAAVERAAAEVLAAPDFDPIAVMSNRPEPDHSRIRVYTRQGFSTAPFAFFKEFQVKTGGYSVEFGRTTALTCGPGADTDCRAATVAPTSGTKAPMKTMMASGNASGTCRMRSAAPIATASTRATMAVPRT